MKKLHWLIVKSFLGPFVVTFFISLFLFLMQFIWKYIGDLVGKGLEWYVILEFIFYSSAYLIPMALPLAVLLSSIMTFGNLGENYELVAIKSAGISLLRSMRPMFLVLGILACLAFYSTNILIPKANLSWGALLYDVTHKKPAFNIKDGVFFKEIDGYAIRVGHKHEDGRTIDDVLIYTNNDNHGNSDVILAKRGKMYLTDDERYLVLELTDGIQYQEMTQSRDYNKSYPNNIMQFAAYKMAIDMSDLQFKRTKKELFKEDYRMLNINELKQRIDSLRKEIEGKNRFLRSYLTPYFHFPDTINTKYNIDAIKEYDFAAHVGDFNTYIDGINNHRLAHNFDTNSIIKKSISDKLKFKQNKSGINASLQESPLEKTPVSEDIRDIAQNREKIYEEALRSNRTLESIVSGQTDETAQIMDLLNKYDAEWHKKFTLAISCILLFFIGAPLGSIIRKGGFGMPLVISILMFIVYFIINVIGEKLAKEGVLETVTGMWLSTFILLPIAIFLTYKASTDSKLFDADSYKAFFRRLKRNKQ
jgi:lipopolysaccharide export system permease protein